MRRSWGWEGRIAAEERQIAYIDEEIGAVEILFKKRTLAEAAAARLAATGRRDRGFAQREPSGLIETNRSQHQTIYHIEISGISVNNGRLERDRSVGIYPLARIARARQSIGEAELRRGELTTTRVNEAVQELGAVQSELFDLRERIRAAEDVLAAH